MRSASTGRSVGSVRFRITVFAMIAFAIAAAVGSTLLLTTIRRSLEQQVRAQNELRLDALTARVQAGTPLDTLTAPGEGAGGFQVQTANGVVVAGSARLTDTPEGVLVQRKIVPTDTGPFLVSVASPLDGVRRTVDTVEDYLLIGIAVLAVLVGVAVWVIVRRALQPVEEIRTEVEEISHGTLHRRVPVPATHDEIARLAGTMNAMLDRLESAATRQREFVSDASHELRSPLAAMRTSIEVTDGHAAPNGWESVRGDLIESTQRMEALVDGLLVLARAEDDRSFDADTPRVEIADVVADVVAAETARTRRIRVRLGPVVDEVVTGRRDEVARVLRNLLDNAERYAADHVEVSVRRDGEDVVLVVDDDGPGIAVGDRVRVFERFTRLGEDRSRDDGGAGLGLAIVKAITERLGGGVTVVDSRLGGACIEVRLPRVVPVGASTS